MAKYNYNSDYMSRKQDDELQRLEERLTAVYANTTNEVERQFNVFMSRFEPQYEQMRDLVDQGYITESEFSAWAQNKILRSERYKKTVEQMTETLVNTDILAMAMVNTELPLVIAQSYNFVQSLGFAAAEEAGLSVGTFQVYNARTVEAIIKDNPFILSGVNKTEDYRWNKDRVNNAITHSIVKGDSIPQAAKRLQEVTNMDKNGAIRNARTAMTAAENLGRTEASKDLKEKGVPCNDQWSATKDDRTRDTHLLLDGTFRDENGFFGVDLGIPLRFPGDPEGDPSEIYNCRCRISLRLKGIDHSQDGDLYEKFMKEQHPDDWQAMKENKREIDRAEQKADAIQAQADLKANLETTQQGNETIPELPVETSTPEPVPEEPTKPEIKQATTRAEADQLMKEMGFDKVSPGVKKIDEDLYIANVNRLSELTSKFEKLPEGSYFEVGKMRPKAYAEYTMGGDINGIKVNSADFTKVSEDKFMENARYSHEVSYDYNLKEQEPLLMPCADEYLNRYDLTHEYGHILQNTIIFTDEYKEGYQEIIRKYGLEGKTTVDAATGKAFAKERDKYFKENHDKIVKQQKDEIIEIAKELNPDFDYDKNISRYGKSDNEEFFAECFANSQCGAPNELGNATAEWLRRKGYDI